MVLATHAVVGTIVATTFTSNPYIAFIIGFVSHFMIDPIPHWDYKLKSVDRDPTGYINNDVRIDRSFVFDLIKVLFDAFLGTVVSIIIFWFLYEKSSLLVILAAITGAILPDPLQFLYWKTKSKFLFPLQRFHKFIHGRQLKVHPHLGVALQLLVVTLFLSVSLIIKK